MMARQLRDYLYYVASYHLFRQSKLMGWMLNRLGGYSICAKAPTASRSAPRSRILADAERPVVLFPEGTWFRQNDRVGPLQEGLSLITRQAVRQSQRPMVVHPPASNTGSSKTRGRKLRRRLETARAPHRLAPPDASRA